MEIDLASLPADVEQRLRPFLEDLLKQLEGRLLSATVTGAALTADYLPGRSEVDTVLLLQEVTAETLDRLAGMGWVHGRRNLAAPLVLTPEYVKRALDVFPVELFNLKLNHRTVAGPDPVAGLVLEREHLRLQCEREMRADVLALRQNYIRAGEAPRELSEALTSAYAGDLAVFRAVLHLLGQEAPLERLKVLRALGGALGFDTRALEEVDALARKNLRLDVDRLKRLYMEFYAIVGRVAARVDDLAVPSARTQP